MDLFPKKQQLYSSASDDGAMRWSWKSTLGYHSWLKFEKNCKLDMSHPGITCHGTYGQDLGSVALLSHNTLK